MNINPMFVPTLAIAAILCATGFVLGRRNAGTAKAAWWALAVLAAVPGMLMALYYKHWFDDWRWFYEFRAMPFSELSAGALGLLAGLGAQRAAHFGRMRYAVWPGMFFVLLLLITVPYLKPILTPAHYSAFQDKWNGQICMQSTGSSCGAASATTILRHYGFNVTEREVAMECYTSATGTESWYLARAFRKRGLDARFITRPPLPHPLPAPCIAGIRLGAIGHFIAIIRDRNEVVFTGDPRIGPREYSRNELLRDVDFTGFLLVVDPEQ